MYNLNKIPYFHPFFSNTLSGVCFGINDVLKVITVIKVIAAILEARQCFFYKFDKLDYQRNLLFFFYIARHFTRERSQGDPT